MSAMKIKILVMLAEVTDERSGAMVASVIARRDFSSTLSQLVVRLALPRARFQSIQGPRYSRRTAAGTSKVDREND